MDAHRKSIEAIPPNAPDLATTIANVMSSLAAEQREMDKRLCILILHNVPESKSTDPQARKKEDTDFLQSVFSDVLNTPASITDAIRQTWKKIRSLLPDSSKSLFDRLMKKAILRHKLRLREEKNPDHVRNLFKNPT